MMYVREPQSKMRPPIFSGDLCVVLSLFSGN